METTTNIDKIINNKELIGIIIGFIGIVLPLISFIISKNKGQKQINFERFHEKLINILSNQKGEAGLDQQIAIIFELRNFPEYFPVIKRILTDLKKYWKSQNDENVLNNKSFSRLEKEADRTINYMNKCIIRRVFIRIWNRIKAS